MPREWDMNETITFKWDVYAIEFTTVIGQNSEMADYDNPRGYIFDEVYRIQATNQVGDRMTLTSISFSDEDEAQRFANTLDEDSPNNGKDWEWGDPMYGSEAYLADYENQEAILDKMDREAEGLY